MLPAAIKIPGAPDWLAGLGGYFPYAGGMSENNTPDRASDFDDIPTFNREGSAGDNSRTPNVYDKAGKTAPQKIEPQPAAQAEPTAVFDRPVAKEVTVSLSRDSEPTNVFSSADHSQPLASDAPYTSYGDQDFAARPAAQQQPLLDEVPLTQSYEQPVAVAPREDVEEVREKRGTIDFGLLIFRVFLAVYLILDSVATFFGMSGKSLTALEQSFADYLNPSILSVAIPAMELAAGVFLLFGLLTPVAAAVGTAAVGFLVPHAIYTADSFSWLNMPAEVWLAFLVAGGALTLQFTGPGVISFDTSRSWARRPLASSWIFAIVGIAGAVALWWFGAGVNPFN